MKIALFSAKAYEKQFFDEANQAFDHALKFIDASLNPNTAGLADRQACVCCFVSDILNQQTLNLLKDQGIKLIALRSAGYNHVNLEAAKMLQLPVVNVPVYSPHAVAEHAVGLLLSLNGKIHIAHARVQNHNFNLDGLMGRNLAGKTVGVIGTGNIGAIFAAIMHGFGCTVIAHDLVQNPELVKTGRVTYVALDTLYAQADIISLHLPLCPSTHHMIDMTAFSRMKQGVLLINTARGGLVESQALIAALESGHLGGIAMDVYEHEEGLFFQDLSGQVLQDPILNRLLTFSTVLITPHQAFFTQEALINIAKTTLQNVSDFERGKPLINQLGKGQK